MPGVPFLPELKIGKSYRISCAHAPYVGLVFCDVFAVLCCIGLAVFMFFYMRMLGKTSISPVKRPTTVADDERKPILSEPIEPTPITDASLPQDPTAGYNPFDPKHVAQQHPEPATPAPTQQ
jgi:hypothetical protein